MLDLACHGTDKTSLEVMSGMVDHKTKADQATTNLALKSVVVEELEGRLFRRPGGFYLGRGWAKPGG